jgi:hypothetical protein
MPQAIPKGLTRDDVLRALADLDAGVEHPFGPPTGYEVVHEGKRYPPKAVVGLACRSLLERILRPGEFSGGEAPGQANYVLRELGFAVAPKGALMSKVDEPESADQSRDWTRSEVDLVVAGYFAMLGAELAGAEYSKAEHNRGLRPLLGDRTRSSVEYKHQNISAGLWRSGRPTSRATSRPATTRGRCCLRRSRTISPGTRSCWTQWRRAQSWTRLWPEMRENTASPVLQPG